MQRFKINITWTASKEVEVLAKSEDEARKFAEAIEQPTEFKKNTDLIHGIFKLEELQSMLKALLIKGEGYVEFKPLTIGDKSYDSVNIENEQLLVWDSKGKDHKTDEFKGAVLYTLLNRALDAISENVYTDIPKYESEDTTPTTTKRETTEDGMEETIPEEEIQEVKTRRWHCYYSEWEGNKRVNDFKEWCEAETIEEARKEFEDRYRQSIAEGTVKIDGIEAD